MLMMFLVGTSVALAGQQDAGPRKVSMKPAPSEVPLFEILEVTLNVSDPVAKNPFRYRDLGRGGLTVQAMFTRPSGGTNVVDGFSDDNDGKVFRLRYCPSQVGKHRYRVTYEDDAGRNQFTGSFTATPSKHPGFLRTDPKYPYTFQWSASGEHFFHLGATAYSLIGQSMENIKASIDLCAEYKFNKIRFQMAIDGSPAYGVPPSEWRDVNPFLGAGVTDYANTDYDRYNIATYKKAEETIAYMKAKGIVADVIFILEKSGLPGRLGAGTAREKNYYRYTVARLAAFSNVMWDLGNEHNEYRKVPNWANEMGPLVRRWDPYDHLISAHGYQSFAYYGQQWAGWGHSSIRFQEPLGPRQPDPREPET